LVGQGPKSGLSDLRLKAVGIGSVRTPFGSPQVNAIAERWVKSVRTECLDYFLILNARHLRSVIGEYVTWFNRWRPHLSIVQSPPCKPAPPTRASNQRGNEIAGALYSVGCTTCTDSPHGMPA
jgi:transposase InsO family protein